MTFAKIHMKFYLGLLLFALGVVSALAIPPHLHTPIKKIQGEVLEIVKIDKGGLFSFVRLKVKKGVDQKHFEIDRQPPHEGLA